MDPEPLHDREAGAIDDRERLILERFADLPGNLDISGFHVRERDASCKDAAPERIGGRLPQPSLHEQPRLDEHVVRRYARFGRDEDCAGARVLYVTAIHCGVED